MVRSAVRLGGGRMQAVVSPRSRTMQVYAAQRPPRKPIRSQQPLPAQVGAAGLMRLKEDYMDLSTWCALGARKREHPSASRSIILMYVRSVLQSRSFDPLAATNHRFFAVFTIIFSALQNFPCGAALALSS